MTTENEPTPPDPEALPRAIPVPETQVTAGRRGKPLTALSAEDLITLNDEIAGMARAGLPLDQGMSALAKEMRRGRLQRVTADIAVDLKSGKTLPEAMERQAGRVPPFYAGLVAAGVRAGSIDSVLATLTVYARTIADVRAMIVGALIYPAIVLLLAFGLFLFVFFGVVPQYEEIFAAFKLKLPFLTELLLGISHHPLAVIGVPVGLVLALFAARAAMDRRRWTRVLYGLPLFGVLLRSARLAAFTDLLGILVDHGLPLPEAYVMAGESSSDPLMAETAGLVREDLSHGQPLGEVLRRRQLVPELVAWMTAMGERRGNLGPTLHHLANLYRRQAESRANLLRNVLPPFLVITSGGILIAMFALGLLLPMLSLLEGLSGGLTR